MANEEEPEPAPELKETKPEDAEPVPNNQEQEPEVVTEEPVPDVEEPPPAKKKGKKKTKKEEPEEPVKKNKPKGKKKEKSLQEVEEAAPEVTEKPSKIKKQQSVTISEAMGPKKKKKGKKRGESSEEQVPEAPSAPDLKAKKEKKAQEEAPEVTERPSKIRKQQSVTISEAHLGAIGPKKKKKGKKRTEPPDEQSPETAGTAELNGKKGKKGKKLKKVTSLQSSSSSRQKMQKSSSKSQQELEKMSQRSLEKGMSRISSFLIEMKSKSDTVVKESSVWTLAEDGSEESAFSDEEIIDEMRVSSHRVMKKKKGKKGEKKSEPGDTEKKKKGKKRKEKPEAGDILPEITKKLAQAEEAEPKEKKKKGKKEKGPKKKLSKKEKQRLAAELAEKARISAEEEAERAAELERIRLQEERAAAIEKEKREGFEQQIRMEQLESILDSFKEIVNYNKQLRTDAKTQADWEFYVNCGRLPNPSQCDQMNTFLHLWENMVEDTSMEEAARRTIDVLELLNDLDDLIDTTEEQHGDSVANWKWVRLLFRQQQAKSLDVATYRLLRNIEKNLNRIDIPTADYKYQDENIAICLWLRIQLPTPLPNPRRPPKPRIEVNFPEMKLEVQFPLTIDGDKTAVRALYVKYDHLSDLSESYQKPKVPDQYDIDLYTAMKKEWREKLLYKYYNRVRKTLPEPTEPVAEEVIGPEEEVPSVPYQKLEPTASEYVISNEDALYTSTRTNLVKTVGEDVVNLRRYSIIGGVYSLNLIHQPPQPQDFVTLEMNLTPLYLPKKLELVDLYLDYDSPKPPEPGVRRLPEEIEEEMKKHEEELEKLILITLTWPEHVIFLELPMVCYWDEEDLVWSKTEVHDLKHNEEKGQLSFRTRKGGTFALAVYRYANLPYQTWEMKPEANGSISLQITAAILMVEFNVKDGLIALSQLQNSPNNALQDIVGTYFPLPKLIRLEVGATVASLQMLQSAGVDVFPAFDAFCYIETTCEKHWPMEKHLYFNMAQLAICFNFAWSRWNVPAGRRSIVLQMREYNTEKTKQRNHLMLHVTPLNALYVDCTEVSQTFNEEGIDNMKFYPDLFHLMKGTSSMGLKNKIAKASKELIYAVYELLMATRMVSFS